MTEQPAEVIDITRGHRDQPQKPSTRLAAVNRTLASVQTSLVSFLSTHIIDQTGYLGNLVNPA
jgi:hypothetical protein